MIFAVAIYAVDFVDHESDSLVALTHHDQATETLGLSTLFPVLALIDVKQFSQGQANKQLAADIGDAKHCAVPAVWKRMDRTGFGHFVKNTSWECQPFLSQTEQDRCPKRAGFGCRTDLAAGISSPFVAIVRRLGAIQQPPGYLFVSGAIAAMEMLLQFGTRLVTSDAYPPPAVVNFNVFHRACERCRS
ncbi:hypothetical protein X741_32005 [Mesorhizobium sp. LNHC229A00]|nr:hypothetical protein X741_32005 [Mesorhizobium sp. LNHC229A00]